MQSPVFYTEQVVLSRPADQHGVCQCQFKQPLPSKVIRPEIETAMKELMEKYRPVRQRTVR